jgi:hypothetical protein
MEDLGSTKSTRHERHTENTDSTRKHILSGTYETLSRIDYMLKHEMIFSMIKKTDIIQIALSKCSGIKL